MNNKKIATNIPKYLIEEAVELTGLNQTQALIAGLKELISKQKRHELIKLRGKMDIKINTHKVRQRSKI